MTKFTLRNSNSWGETLERNTYTLQLKTQKCNIL